MKRGGVGFCYQAISLFDPIPSSGLDGKSHTGNVQNCTISGFPDPAAPLVRKGSNFESLYAAFRPLFRQVGR